VWWSIPRILAHRRLRQKVHKFEDSPGYTVSLRSAGLMTPKPKPKQNKTTTTKNNK
jgi:hypothetical protein